MLAMVLSINSIGGIVMLGLVLVWVMVMKVWTVLMCVLVRVGGNVGGGGGDGVVAVGGCGVDAILWRFCCCSWC